LGKATLSFADEYDVQDLFHSQIRPWIKDIRTEEYTPSYASSSTRIDFLLKEQGIVVEIKFVRDGSHAKKVHQELTIDIAHYRAHPDAKALWVIVYDPGGHVKNPEGLRDLTGVHDHNGRRIEVCCYVVGSSGAERVGK
jgi:hypothetical protein